MPQSVSLVCKWCLLAIALPFISANAAAEQSEKPIIVTASRLAEDDSGYSANISIITAEDISNSTARTLPELLDLQAGITTRHLYGNNSARATIDIRGFGAAASQNNLILLDGRRLNDIDLSAVDLASIPLHNIERIEIIRGSGGVLYGDGAVGGTINIITRRPGKEGSQGNIAVSAGSYDARQIQAYASHVSGPFSINLAANSQTSDGYRDNNEYRQESLQADMRLSHDNGEYYLKLGADDQNLNLPGVRTVDYLLGIDELDNDPRGTSTPDDYAERNGYYITTGLSRYISDNTELIVDLGYRYKNENAFFDDYLFGGIFAQYLDTRLSTWSFTPRLKSQPRLFGIPGSMTVGFDYYHSSYNSDRALNPNTIDIPIHQLDVTQDSYAVYARHVMRPDNITYVTLGARLQHVKTASDDRFNAAAPGGSIFDSQAPDEKNSGTEHALELSVKRNLNKNTSLYASYNHAFRIATIDEIFSTFPGLFTTLEPQVSDAIEAGLDYEAGSSSLKASVYYMDLENEIHFNPLTFSNINLDPTRRYGLEISASTKPVRDVALQFAYSYIRSVFREGAFSGNDVPLVPRHTASLTALWKISHSITLSGTVNHVGKKRFDNDQSNSFEQIPSYQTVDMKLSGQWQGWRIDAWVNNLLNEEYIEYGVRSTFSPRYNAFPMPERNFQLSVSRDF